MKRAALVMALTAGFLVGGAIAQTPPDDKEPIPPRSIQLTAEQDHVRDRAKGHAYRASAPQHRDQDWRESTTRYRIADLSTTRGREGTASQNIQILSHRESDRGRISAEHNCGHYQVVLIRAGTLPWSTGDALFPGCGNKARLKIGPHREDAAQSRKFRRRVSGNLGDRNGLWNIAPNCKALHLRKTRANKKVGPEISAGAWPIAGLHLFASEI